MVTYLQHIVDLSPNYTHGRTDFYGVKHHICRFTPHCVVGQCSAARIGEIFRPSTRDASCNYGIGKDGDLVLVVEEKNRSWCSSTGQDPDANDYKAITVEVASDTQAPYAFTEAAYKALIDLAVDIGERYGFSKFIWIRDKAKALAYQPAADECLITVHRWFANKACPGDWLYNRLGDFAAEVNRRLAVPVGPTVTGGPTGPAGLTTTPSAWAAAAWEWAKENGITDGTNPGGPATREQVAAMIWRYWQKHGIGATGK